MPCCFPQLSDFKRGNKSPVESNQISRFKENFDHYTHEGFVQEIHDGWVTKSAWIIANDS